MAKRQGWLEVDVCGLRRLLERRGKEFVLFELVQNAWDEQCTEVNITLSQPDKGLADLVVTDDSAEGFRDLTHAFTLFADSYKRGNASQRGAFNAGDKFVLAMCEEATILSTRGGVIFSQKGRRTTRRRTEVGSQFRGTLKLSTSEWEDIALAVRRLIPPVKTVFNGEEISRRSSIHEFVCLLPTVIADQEGSLRKTVRKTKVRVYQPLAGEQPTLYEMGLPVVATGDKWHVDIQQKVPLNMERDNVTPSYLQSVRVAVLNAMSAHLTAEEACSTWVREAAGDVRVEGNVFRTVINKRFGEHHVTFDPSDPEANRIAISRHMTVITPASLSGKEWENVRRFGASLPAGRVTPSPTPFSPSGRPLKLFAPEKKAAEFWQFERFAQMLGHELTGMPITTVLADDEHWGFRACFGKATLTVNVRVLGEDWFRAQPAQLLENWIPLLIHEFAHAKVAGHLTEEFHKECCRLAGVLARRMCEAPELFALDDTHEIYNRKNAV